VTPVTDRTELSANRNEASDVASIHDDPTIDADGWVRRHLADPVRARESIELYESLGFEVMSRRLQPDDLGPECQACAASVCSSYVLIYTRARHADPSRDDGSAGTEN
jgi:hypothetical protein